MTQTTPKIGHIIVERDIHAYVDDELSSDRRALVEAHLAVHPEKMRRVEWYRMQNAGLRILSGRLASDSAGSPGMDFSEKIPQGSESDRIPMRRVRSVAVVLAVASIAVFSWIHWPVTPLLKNSISQATYSSNARGTDSDMPWPGVFSVSDAQRGALEMVSRGTGAATLDPVPASLQIPGFRRILQPLSIRENALAYNAVYQDDSGFSLGLSVTRHPASRHNPDVGGSEAFTILLKDDRSLIYWEAGPLAYMLTGAFDRRRFISIATDVMALTRNEPIDPKSGMLHADNGSRSNASAASSVTNAVADTVPKSKIHEGVAKDITGRGAALPVR